MLASMTPIFAWRPLYVLSRLVSLPRFAIGIVCSTKRGPQLLKKQDRECRRTLVGLQGLPTVVGFVAVFVVGDRRLRSAVYWRFVQQFIGGLFSVYLRISSAARPISLKASVSLMLRVLISLQVPLRASLCFKASSSFSLSLPDSCRSFGERLFDFEDIVEGFVAGFVAGFIASFVEPFVVGFVVSLVEAVVASLLASFIEAIVAGLGEPRKRPSLRREEFGAFLVDVGTILQVSKDFACHLKHPAVAAADSVCSAWCTFLAVPIGRRRNTRHALRETSFAGHLRPVAALENVPQLDFLRMREAPSCSLDLDERLRLPSLRVNLPLRFLERDLPDTEG
ncbi:hypothetical protein L1887_49935 [Cichorium endivia]|nr:hypothetical protein L1887_49935 [Cichorium endivia]